MSIQTAKYNPGFLSDEDLIRSFVARHTDLELVLQIVRENTSDSNQHILVTGARGMGKTMLALRVVAEVRRTEELNRRWYPLVFAEESYQVSSPGEFWLEALFHLAERTNDQRWRSTHAELREERDEQRLRERALAQLMDFSDAQGKRLLLVVENLEMLLADQISDDDAWVIRHTLQTEPRIMLLATAVTRFDEVENHGKAMFELFKPHNLQPLTEDECKDVWRSITGSDPTDRRIRPIQILTGGNPRLVMIISTFAAHLSYGRLMDDLMQLVDEHTEYFKSHLDGLAAVERKVYLGLAGLWKPATAREVADAVRLDVSKTSSLLGRLAKRGAVMITEQTGRTKCYYVAERMYNIYYLMRRRAGASGRVQALVHFMVGFYSPPDLVKVTARIAEEACALEPESRREHLLTYEAILKDPAVQPVRETILDATPARFFEVANVPFSIRDSGKSEEWKQLEAKLVDLLQESDALDGESDTVAEAKRLCDKAIELAPGKALPRIALACVHERSGEYDRAEELYTEATEIDPKSARAWAKLGQLLHERLSRYDEAEKPYRQAIKLRPDVVWGWAQLAKLLHQHLERYGEAEEAYRKVIEINPEFAWGWGHLGDLLHERLQRYNEAEKAYRVALDLEPDVPWGWVRLGELLHERLERYDEAEEAYRTAIELEPDVATGWARLGQLLHERRERYDEAEAAYRKVIDLSPEDASWAWTQLGNLYRDCLSQYVQAEEAYHRAVTLNDQDAWTWYQLGRLQIEHLERYEEAEGALRKAVEIDERHVLAWGFLAFVLHIHLERYQEAEAPYRKAIELGPEQAAWPWTQLGNLYRDHLERYEEAEGAYRKAIELDSDHVLAWLMIGQLLHEHLDRYEEAEAAYRKAIELAPEQASWPWTKLGDLYCDCLNRYVQAEEAYRNAITADPACAPAWSQLGCLLYERLARPTEGEHAHRTALELAPENAWTWLLLLDVLLDTPDRLNEALGLADQALMQCERDAKLVAMLAWLFCKKAGRASLAQCEHWAREAVTKQPEQTRNQGVLAAVLCASGEGAEALEHARKFAEDAASVKGSRQVAVHLFVDLAAGGHAREALDILEKSPSAEFLEPLIVGLQMFLGDKVNVAVEIEEVGKDVLQRIRDRQKQLSTESPVADNASAS